MPKFHYSDDGKLRFYVPRKMSKLLKWGPKARVTAVIDDDGTVVITEDPPNTVKGWFSRQMDYTVVELPLKHMTGRTRMRLDMIDESKLVVKFFE